MGEYWMEQYDRVAAERLELQAEVARLAAENEKLAGHLEFSQGERVRIGAAYREKDDESARLAGELKSYQASYANVLNAMWRFADKRKRAIRWAWNCRRKWFSAETDNEEWERIYTQSEEWRKAYQRGKYELYALGGEIQQAAMEHLPCNESALDSRFTRLLEMPRLKAKDEQIAALRTTLATIAEQARTWEDSPDPWQAIAQIETCARRALEGK